MDLHRRTFAALRHRNFRLFWISQLVSLTGTWMHAVAQGWLVLELTDQPFWLGAVGAANTLPVLAFSLLGGVAADRLPKRSLLIASQSASATLALGLGLLALGGHVQVWHVLVVALLLGTANAVLDTIRDDARVRHSNYKVILLDMKRVTGMDISALNTFVQIKSLCERSGVKLIYSGVAPETRESLLMLGAVTLEHGQPLMFPDADYAVEYMEDVLLTLYQAEAESLTIYDHLSRILDDLEKVRILLEHMKRVQVSASEILFEQGDLDNGIYMLERGSMTALIGRSSLHRRAWRRVFTRPAWAQPTITINPPFVRTQRARSSSIGSGRCPWRSRKNGPPVSSNPEIRGIGPLRPMVPVRGCGRCVQCRRSSGSR